MFLSTQRTYASSVLAMHARSCTMHEQWTGLGQPTQPGQAYDVIERRHVAFETARGTSVIARTLQQSGVHADLRKLPSRVASAGCTAVNTHEDCGVEHVE